MPRYQWSRLNNQQVGAYFEYFVKMELAMFGFEVYTTEVDNRGIDSVARQKGSPFIEVQVKSPRDFGYIFMPKTYFMPRENLYVAVGLLFEGKEPLSFLVPAVVWSRPDSVFVERNYGGPGQKSKPEWGINVSRKNLPSLEPYAMAAVLGRLCPAQWRLTPRSTRDPARRGALGPRRAVAGSIVLRGPKAPHLAGCVSSNVRRHENATVALPPLSPKDRAEIVRLEEAMWRETTRFDLEFQQTRFAEDFFEFGRSGRVYTRQEVIRVDAHPIQATLPLEALTVRVVDIDTVLVTYNSKVVHDGVTEHARRSSLWSRTSSGWVMRFHQGTPFMPVGARSGESAA